MSRVMTNSSEALKHFETSPQAFDLIITDMAMPNMAGDVLAQKIMEIRPDIPIILCTGFSEHMDEKQALFKGFKGFLLKPVSKERMAKEVHAVLKARQRT